MRPGALPRRRLTDQAIHGLPHEGAQGGHGTSPLSLPHAPRLLEVPRPFHRAQPGPGLTDHPQEQFYDDGPEAPQGGSHAGITLSRRRRFLASPDPPKPGVHCRA